MFPKCTCLSIPLLFKCSCHLGRLKRQGSQHPDSPGEVVGSSPPSPTPTAVWVGTWGGRMVEGGHIWSLHVPKHIYTQRPRRLHCGADLAGASSISYLL